MIGKTISHYRIDRKIGGGGMGEVYKAQDTRLGRAVALKFIHADLVTDELLKKRFLREAQAASSLDHPNICNIYEVDETPEGRPFISMAYYGGESLAKRIEAAPLTSREAFQIGFSIGRGLSCAHRRGIIHRDVKPGNVVITEEGYVKIVDFGLAKLAGSSRLTDSDKMVGTIRYMSPEQIAAKEVDHRTDVWALGVILYELTTGERPWRGDIDAAVMYSILHDDPAAVDKVNPDIPAGGARIISRCLERDIDKRYQSVDDFLSDLGELATEMGWGSSIAGLTVPIMDSPARPRSRRMRWILAAIAAIAIAGVTVRWWVTRPPSLYTTDVRVAVMPLVNKTHPARDALVSGLTVTVVDMLDQASRRHDSMWVVPDRLVRYAELANLAGVREAFGVNRIVTGDVQRFENRQLLLLELRDAETLEKLQSASVSFEVASPSVLADSLPLAITSLTGIGVDNAMELSKFLPTKATAIESYLEGVGSVLAGDFDAAITGLTAASNAEPTSAVARNALGWACWLKYGRSDDELLLELALSNVAAAVQLSPSMWQARFNLGEIKRRTGDDEGAIVAFKWVEQDDPGNQQASRRLADVYRSQNRIDESEVPLRAAIERRPDYFEPHRQLAMHFYWIGEDGQALNKLRETLAFAPNDAFSLNMLGVLYHDRSEFTEARKRFERSFQLLPDCEPCCNVALMAYFQGDFESSASYYELALEYCGDDSDVLGNWASSLYWVEGKREEAIGLFHQAIEQTTVELAQNPDDPSLVGRLVEYYAMVGDEENARRMIDRAQSFAKGDGEVLYSIGDAYEILGDRSAALRYLTDAVRHGFPVARIKATRELADLVRDARFQQVVSGEDDSGESPAASSD